MRRNTRDRPLLGCQRVEIALALDRVGLGARIFLHGLRMVKTPDGARILRSEAIKRPNDKKLAPRHQGVTERRQQRARHRDQARPLTCPKNVSRPEHSGARADPNGEQPEKTVTRPPNQFPERRTKPRSTSHSKHARGNGVKKPVPKKGE
jgi:hypothetical protein